MRLDTLVMQKSTIVYPSGQKSRENIWNIFCRLTALAHAATIWYLLFVEVIASCGPAYYTNQGRYMFRICFSSILNLLELYWLRLVYWVTRHIRFVVFLDVWPNKKSHYRF